MSTTAFARAFRASTGEAVWAYVQRWRTERARELLTGTGLPAELNRSSSCSAATGRPAPTT